MKTDYYDCHMHELASEKKKGFLIALDGLRGSSGGYSNSEIMDIAEIAPYVIPVQYVDWQFCRTQTPIVKYHPRREKYSMPQVMEDIRRRGPKAVIIDTLNQPDWQPQDYWMLAREFPKLPFLFSHAGGYDMLSFINMVTYQKNIWIDFSYVQDIFGWWGEQPKLKPVTDLMEYGMVNPKIYGKLMFGTDSMREEEEKDGAILELYAKYQSFPMVVHDNYLSFLKEAGINE